MKNRYCALLCVTLPLLMPRRNCHGPARASLGSARSRGGQLRRGEAQDVLPAASVASTCAGRVNSAAGPLELGHCRLPEGGGIGPGPGPRAGSAFG